MTKVKGKTPEAGTGAAPGKTDFDKAYSDAEAQRLLLQEKYKCRVNAAVLAGGPDEEPCAVYFKAATTFTKMQCMDMAMQSPMKASATMFEATVLKEASDPRVFIQDNDNDNFYLGAIQYCGEQIKIARHVLKKN